MSAATIRRDGLKAAWLRYPQQALDDACVRERQEMVSKQRGAQGAEASLATRRLSVCRLREGLPRSPRTRKTHRQVEPPPPQELPGQQPASAIRENPAIPAFRATQQDNLLTVFDKRLAHANPDTDDGRIPSDGEECLASPHTGTGAADAAGQCGVPAGGSAWVSQVCPGNERPVQPAPCGGSHSSGAAGGGCSRRRGQSEN